MRAGLARACGDTLADVEPLRTASAAAGAARSWGAAGVDAVCGQEIRERVELGQPGGLPCPHCDCGVLAVRVTRRHAAAARGPGAAGSSLGGDRGAAGDSAGVQLPGESSLAVAASSACCLLAVDESTCERGCVPQKGALGNGSLRCSSTRHDVEGAEPGLRVEGVKTDHDKGTSVVEVELGAVHNSVSMGFGYWALGMESPSCTILRRQAADALPADAAMCLYGTHCSWVLDT